MIYLSNAFSLQMSGNLVCETMPISLFDAQNALGIEFPGYRGAHDYGVTEYSPPKLGEEGLKDDNVRKLPDGIISCVGHADVASVMSKILTVRVPFNRISVSLKEGDTLIVGQYVGPRLPEGATRLPEGAVIKWYVVTAYSNTRDQEAHVKMSYVHKNIQKAFQYAVPVNQDEIIDLAYSESIEYGGYPNEEARQALAEKLGVSLKIIQFLISLYK
jgi:hypothetical protein